MMKSRKVIKIVIPVVLVLVIALVFILATRDNTTKKHSIDSVIVDQFEPNSVIIYTADFSGYEIMSASITEDTKNYDAFIQSNDLVGRKIRIYYSGEIMAIFPTSVGILDYELGEKASQEEMEDALGFYTETDRDTYEAHARQQK